MRVNSELAAEQKNVGKRLLLFAFSAVLILASIEGLVRLRQLIKHGTAAVTLYKTVVDPASGLHVPAAGPTTRTIWINSLGFRSPELVSPKPTSTIRLAFVGDSMTFCAEVSSNQATWPDRVWNTIQHASPEAKVDYVNAGVAGFTTVESLTNLRYRVEPLHPDVIIIDEGITDLTRDTRELAAEKGLFTGREGQPSFLGRWSLAWSLLEKNVKRTIRVRRAGTDTRLKLSPEMLVSRGFEQRIRALVEESQRVAPVVAVATITYKARKNQTPEQQLHAAEWSLYYMPYMTADAIILGFEEYNREIRKVAAQTSAILIANEESIPADDQYFKDDVHLTDAGCALMARRVVSALTRSGAFQNLVASRRASGLVKTGSR
jgi:lysophospholipase L1-like esterase